MFNVIITRAVIATTILLFTACAIFALMVK
jgi:hypothetical protein